MKDKLEKLLYVAGAAAAVLFIVLGSLILFGTGLVLVNKPSTLSLILGILFEMASGVGVTFGVLLAVYYVKALKASEEED